MSSPLSELEYESLVSKVNSLSPEEKEVLLNQLDVEDMLLAIARRYREMKNSHTMIYDLLHKSVR